MLSGFGRNFKHGKGYVDERADRTNRSLFCPLQARDTRRNKFKSLENIVFLY